MKCNKDRLLKAAAKAQDAFYTFAAHERVMDDYRDEGRSPPARLRNGAKQALDAYRRAAQQGKQAARACPGYAVQLKDRNGPVETVRVRAERLRRKMGL
jgi:hypothetical protein